jgi:hypothetical protein
MRRAIDVSDDLFGKLKRYFEEAMAVKTIQFEDFASRD